MMWGTGWGNWIGLLMMVFFWGGLVALVILAIRGWDANRRRDSGNDRPDARAILEERFAKGEIPEDEFEQRRRVLEHATR